MIRLGSDKNNFAEDHLKYFDCQANTGKQQPGQFEEGQVQHISSTYQHQHRHHHSTNHGNHQYYHDQHNQHLQSKWVRESDKATQLSKARETSESDQILTRDDLDGISAIVNDDNRLYRLLFSTVPPQKYKDKVI